MNLISEVPLVLTKSDTSPAGEGCVREHRDE